jgi:archaellum biogenesis protein FlaJ (TadC family)
MAHDEYIPGVCNIGRAEIRQRQLLAWIALAVTIGMWIAFAVFAVAPLWRLTLFFPAAVSAVGFLQAAWHFCAAFGLGGVFNFGPSVGKTDKVRHEDTAEQAEYRRHDRRTAIQIIALSALVGVIVAAAGFLVPL